MQAIAGTARANRTAIGAKPLLSIGRARIKPPAVPPTCMSEVANAAASGLSTLVALRMVGIQLTMKK